MMREKEFKQGKKAKALIEFILARKDAYYQANVTKRWREAVYGIECALDQRFTSDEEGMTRSHFYSPRIVTSDDALNETYTDGYTMANPLFVMRTKRRGTQEFAERAGHLIHNVWEEAEAMDTWLAFMRDINRFGMGVGYTRWEHAEGEAPAMVMESMPWGMLAAVAMEQRTLLSRPILERIHPYDWWGYWRTHLTPPWEGVSRQWGGCELALLLDDPDYVQGGVKLAMERLKRGGGPEDEYFHGADYDDEEVPDRETLMVYEYWGDLYGLKEWGMEDDRREYQVIVTDEEVLMKPRRNRIPGYRPIKRPRGILVNDWCCGRPVLLPQVPALRIQNFLLNSSLDDVADRLYAGWAVWEQALMDPDEFLNPQGIGVPVRMNKDATKEKLPQKLGGGQSGIQADVERIINGFIEKDLQATSFADVLSVKGGLQNGTARAANIIASQGARKVKAIYENANRTGLNPFGEQLLIHKVLNTDPEDMAAQTRDGEEFTLSPEELGFLLERNLWDCSDSFRRDPFLDAANMERLAKAGAVEFFSQYAGDPELPAKFWRSYARSINCPDYDEYFPLGKERKDAGAMPPELGIPAAGRGPARGATPVAPAAEPGAEVTEMAVA